MHGIEWENVGGYISKRPGNTRSYVHWHVPGNARRNARETHGKRTKIFTREAWWGREGKNGERRRELTRTKAWSHGIEYIAELIEKRARERTRSAWCKGGENARGAHSQFAGNVSPVSELSLPRALYRGWTQAREERVQDNLQAHAQNAAIFPPNKGKNHIWQTF